MYTFFTNMTTWSMGANRSAQEAARDGELPAILAREHPVCRTPVAAYIVSGTVATAVLLFAALFVKSQDDLFYAIFSASAAIFLLPYALLFPSAWTLRRKDPDTPRPFRVPGPTGVLAALSAVTTAIVLATFLRFLSQRSPTPRRLGVHRPAAGHRRGDARRGRADRRHRCGCCPPSRRPPRAMTRLHDTTPAADGFRMPGEFEPHSGCWMIWPERPDNWHLGAKPAQAAFAAVAAAIHPSDPVTMAVSARQFEHARAALPGTCASSRCRPTIPGCATSGRRSWSTGTAGGGGGGSSRVGRPGGLYSWDQDDLVAAKVAEIEGDDRYRAPLVLERLDPRRRREHITTEVPAQSQPIRSSAGRTSRRTCATTWASSA
jgi:hypothetical protein